MYDLGCFVAGLICLFIIGKIVEFICWLIEGK